ncbi:glycosyltransferase family 4 protein [Azospirillum rugosum]|uniref:Glycosyltransferase involved in cell wall biosynthesis n=1 Tax=Azospirillum rugosum TaxID=416170 RepID=A0ABS4SG55_9PROT|nr:glycosyltransferase family 4 protein [Azospirillum rugosum]MBP2291425.1 glycosyltransferase involved in cell wall biosynthesis [Azospirillum rugosum]MDQ0525213.1 glycosyltransferase involved in cell wall biosynthesis [Azospirillum rugosum]
MKILIFAHRLEIGGTQFNAIELGAALRDQHGFDVVLWATPGPMLSLIERKGLRYVAAPDARLHPSPTRMQELRALVRQEKPDLIHAWDWWQGLEAYYATHLPMKVPLIVTDMMFDFNRVLPKAVPTTFGTPQLVERAAKSGWKRPELLLPPVDVVQNAPDAVDARPFKEQFGVRDDEITLVTVSRLAEFMKADGIIRTVEAVRRLGRHMPLKALIVGDGTARSRLQAMADDVNAELGRSAVVLTGPLDDPRPAYAAADIVIGMSGSVMRAMAIGKPVIIQGWSGFAAVFSPDTAPTFHYTGMYGTGDGDPSNQCLSDAICRLAEDASLRTELGRFGRDFILQHHALDVVAPRLAQFCRSACEEAPRLPVIAKDALRTAMIYCRERRFLSASRDLLPTDRKPLWKIS